MKERIQSIGTTTTIILAINIIAFLLNIFMGGGSLFGLFISGGGDLKDFGELTYTGVIYDHEWWRLITCGYLHVGIIHLTANVFALLAIGSKMEQRMGSLSMFVIYHLGIAVTAFLWCLIFRTTSMIGASLGIFVLLGMYIGQMRGNADIKLSGQERSYLIPYGIIGSLLGVTTAIVHGIGFCVGLLFSFFTAHIFRRQ